MRTYYRRITPFIFTNAEHHLEIVDRRSTTFRSEHIFNLKAQMPSRFFVREYGWSGSGVEKEHVPELLSDIDAWGFPYQRIHGPLVVEGETRILVVDLGRTIEEGESQIIKFRHKMKDLAGTFRPEFSVTPSTKISSHLKMSIDIPKWDGIEVMYQCFTHDTAKVMESSRVHPSKDEGGRLLFVKEIIRPHQKNMGHKLHWTHRET